MTRITVTARVERQGDTDLYSVVVNHDRLVMTDESYSVASALAHALTHPEQWEPTEAYEIADVITKAVR